MEPPPPPSPSKQPPQPRPRRGLPLVAVGGALALVAGLGIAWVLVGGKGDDAAPPASEAGLVIDSSPTTPGKIDPGKPLRCFVQGRFVGELSLTECAQRNGVATDSLDVGLDQTGALAAADQAGQTLTPLPPAEAVQPVQPAEAAGAAEPADPAQAPAAAAVSACWRHGGGRWRRLGDMDVNACVQTLFAGRCEPQGGASYGRYGQQTLRRVTGRIEVSDDNKSFRTLAPQNPDCSLPPIG